MVDEAAAQWMRDNPQHPQPTPPGRRMTNEELEQIRAGWYAAERAAYAAVTDPAVVAVLDVLAPADERGERWCIYVRTDESNPDAAELIPLAEQIVQAVRAAAS